MSRRKPVLLTPSAADRVENSTRKVEALLRPRRGRLPESAQRPAAHHGWVALSSLTQTSGRYPGHWFQFNPSDNSLTQKAVVWVREVNGGTLSTGVYYWARQEGPAPDGTIIFVPVDTGSSTFDGGTVTGATTFADAVTVEGDTTLADVTVGGDLTVTGTTTTNGAVVVNNTLALSSTTASISSNQNDYGPGSKAVLELTTDATRTVTGFSGGSGGRYLTVVNAGSNSLVLANGSASSSSSNRIVTETGADLTLLPKQSATLLYLASLSKWLVVDQPWESGDSGPPVGSITSYAGSSVPTGWLECDGSAVSRSTYSDLFAAIGTTWGAGDTTTTFNVSDLQGRVCVGAGSGSGLTSRTLAGIGGEESHALTTGELASHHHTFADGATSLMGANGFDYIIMRTGISTVTTDDVGSGDAHENMPPFAVVKVLIKATT